MKHTQDQTPAALSKDLLLRPRGMGQSMLWIGLVGWIAACGAPRNVANTAVGAKAAEASKDPQPTADAAQPATSTANEVDERPSAPAIEPGDDPGQPSAASDGRAAASAPMTDEEAALLAAIPSESIPAPKEFYYRSNEWRHDLLVEPLKGLGGAVVCVGSDQCYTLAALAKAELILAMDYDSRLPLVHEIYSLLIPVSASPAELIARFAPENEADTIALLEKELEGSPKKSRLLRMFRSLRSDWHPYLGRVASRTIEGRAGTWLTTQEHYDHVRALFQAGRVVARTGDLTGETTFRAIGAAAKRLGVHVRVLYMSNAEQFFRYTPAFRANIDALPIDERSLIVRTLRDKRLPNARDDKWHYILQELVDFQERLATGAYTRSWTLLDDLVEAGPPHVASELSTITRSTPRRHLERAQKRRATRE